MNRMLMGFPVFLLTLAAFPPPTLAEPVVTGVSGSVTDGATVTISGLDFGYHSHNGQSPSRNFNVFPGGSGFLCSWWDNFDSYTGTTAGDTPMDDNYRFHGEPGEAEISTVEKRGENSVFCGPLHTGGAFITEGSVVDPRDPYDLNGVWYYSWWMFFPSNWDSVSPDQWKLVRFWNWIDPGVTVGDFYLGITPTRELLGHHSDISCSSCVSNTDNFFSMNDTVQGATFLGYWHRFEMLADLNGDELLWYIDGHLWYDGNATYGSALFPAYVTPSFLTESKIDNVHHGYEYNVGYYDDTYANNTWARVEICQTNEFTCDDTKKLVKNLQLPITWSATSITAELNLEGMSGTAYLFVVDANGTPNSSGYAIEIGGGQTDTDPPVISDVQSTTESDTSTSVSWDTNELATSQVDYGTTIAYGQSSTLDPTLVTNHNVMLTGLNPQTLYHYRVRSRDAAGNLAVSGDYTFTTSDTTPPDPPENVDAEAIT